MIRCPLICLSFEVGHLVDDRLLLIRLGGIVTIRRLLFGIYAWPPGESRMLTLRLMVCTFFLIPAVDISICSGNYGALGSSTFIPISVPANDHLLPPTTKRMQLSDSIVLAAVLRDPGDGLSGQSGTRERLAFRACLAAACGCPCIAGEQADAIALALDDRRALFRGAIFPRRDRAPPVGMHAHTNAGQAKDLELAPAYQCATWSQRFQGPQFSPNWDLDSASPRALAGRLAWNVTTNLTGLRMGSSGTSTRDQGGIQGAWEALEARMPREQPALP